MRIRQDSREILEHHPEYYDMVYHLALLGATDGQIATALQVSPNHINAWKRTNPLFARRLSEGKLAADAAVANALFRSATGYDYEEDQVVSYKGQVTVTRVTRHRPANPWAAARWLGLRQRALWHDTTNVDVIQNNYNTLNIDLTNCSTEELAMLKRLALDAPRIDPDPLADDFDAEE